ncbi:Fic/DOC family protein [Pectobacterium parmentieri]|uniref:protein adenylyltransferase n=1 Tax=Pectobacterium parmentieri TaxID=1905730 RepID=A0A0H3HYM6_PECPM|nr:Fic family protein [Pectobacterium parmentieri]AFI88951.1 Cell filamentation protein Fic [Pectobacterium parmentieri]MBI0470984.1 cell filamentation protein Fic [Pectobacterium parmentieri]MBI0492477.1 cell filamentation protein Fic [Pectobacterium parmentieri]MBI0555557.1 cell filamentation protein Fic [Pectobacterium parmentieri]MBI0569626.1 cell filamentation protein Fic [Pectobacterium parmentieri]
MPDKYGSGQDPYTYPDSNVLINKLGINDDSKFGDAERQLSELAVLDIEFEEPPYDLHYWCGLHGKIFGDLFDWAGEIRCIDISKGQTRFCTASRIEIEANKIFTQLSNDAFLQGFERPALIIQLAEYYSDLNVIHPFREGNGRSQRLLFEHMIINCGYGVSFEKIGIQEWLAANVAGYHGNTRPLADIFDKSIL